MTDKIKNIINEAIDKYRALPTVNGLKPSFDEYLAETISKRGAVILPCEVGDNVYRIWSVGKHGKSVAEFTVTKITQVEKDVWIVSYQKISKSLRSAPTIYRSNIEDFGKTVFTSRKEAAAKI